MNKSALVHRFLYAHTFSFLLGKFLGIQCCGFYGKTMFNFYKELSYFLYYSASQPATHKGSSCFVSSQTVDCIRAGVLFSSSFLSILIGVLWYVIVVLVCNSLKT